MIFTILLTLIIFLYNNNNNTSASVWGSSVKHNPQRVGKEHILEDEDVVQIIKK